jgi:NADH-quinone oxidoreductase subunit M
VLGVVLGAAYLLWLYQRVMFGNITNPLNENLPDLNGREWATLLPLVFLAFWIGIYPAPMFHVLEAPVERLVRTVNPSYFPPAVPAALMDAPLPPPMVEEVPVLPTPAPKSPAAPGKREVK